MEAGAGLKKIVASAQRSTASVREIARAAAEQAGESRMVVESTEKVDGMTRKIAGATQEQARGSELIRRASERMAEIAYRVRNSSAAQVEATRQITASVEEVNRMVAQINNAIKEQGKNIINVLETAAAVRNVSVENTNKALETDVAIEELVRLNDKLIEGVKRFKLRR